MTRAPGFARIVCLLLWAVLAGAPAVAGTIRVPDGRTIIDSSGRTITVKKPFLRIISLYGAHTENLFDLGAGDSLIGVPPKSEFPAEAAKKPVFSYRDGPERFLAARPDLVLVRPMIERGYPKLVKRLEQSKITVVSLQPGDVDEMFAYWSALGVLTGQADAATEMVRGFQEAVKRFRALADGTAQRPRVYFESIHSKVKTFSPGSMPLFCLDAAGGENVAGNAAPVRGTNIAAYGMERLLEKADQIDVYLAQVGAMNRTTRETIREAAGYSVIRAVRDGNVHLIDERIVSRPTVRLLSGIAEIGRILHPERFTPAAVRAIRDGRTGGTQPENGIRK